MATFSPVAFFNPQLLGSLQACGSQARLANFDPVILPPPLLKAHPVVADVKEAWVWGDDLCKEKFVPLLSWCYLATFDFILTVSGRNIFPQKFSILGGVERCGVVWVSYGNTPHHVTPHFHHTELGMCYLHQKCPDTKNSFSGTTGGGLQCLGGNGTPVGKNTWGQHRRGAMRRGRRDKGPIGEDGRTSAEGLRVPFSFPGLRQDGMDGCG